MDAHNHGAAPGLAAPEHDEARRHEGTRVVRLRSDPTAAPNRRATWKAIYKQGATLQAQAALAGVRVDPIEDDHGTVIWIVSKWSLTRHCETLGEVRELLARMGVAL